MSGSLGLDAGRDGGHRELWALQDAHSGAWGSVGCPWRPSEGPSGCGGTLEGALGPLGIARGILGGPDGPCGPTLGGRPLGSLGAWGSLGGPGASLVVPGAFLEMVMFVCWEMNLLFVQGHFNMYDVCCFVR